MKIAICGATGSTGQELLSLALQAGHEVTICVRTPSKVTTSNDNLTVKKGDANNIDDLRAAFSGSEAVLSCLGRRGYLEQRTATTFYTDTIRAIIEAMRLEGVKRLIAITSSGLADDPSAPWFYRKVVKPQLRKTYENMAEMEELIHASSLDWTIVRPCWLRPGAKTGQYRVADYKTAEGGWKIGVGDVAHFMLEEIQQRKWVGAHPALAY